MIFCLFNIFYLVPAYAANLPPIAANISPQSGSSNPEQEIYFVTTFIDPNGAQDINLCYLLINTSVNPGNCLMGLYNNISNKLYLMNDAGVAPLGGYAPGSNAIIQNTYCSLNVKKTTVSRSGAFLYIRWCVMFKSRFLGLKKTYIYVKDRAGANTGWVQKGIWTVRPPVMSVSLSPKLWNIGSTEINRTITMTPQKKITVTNNSQVTEAFSLSLINPAGWTAANIPANDTYVISGVFCSLTDIPTGNRFNQDTLLYEDVISTTPKRATPVVFGYNMSGINGSSVPKGQKRALYLQFKSPTLTDEQTEKNISVIVNCEIP